MTRRTRQVGTLVLTAAAIAYLVWKIELSTTLDVLADTNLAWFALATFIMFVTVPVLAWRWGRLLEAHGIYERVPWLTRAYFVAYTAGQVLPTAAGRRCGAGRGDRAHGTRAGATVVTGTVVLERGLGGAATVLARGDRLRALRSARYDVGAYLWLEGLFVFGTLVLGFLFFARSARPLLRRIEPLLERLRIAGPLRSFYEGVHHFRSRPRLLWEAVRRHARRRTRSGSSRSGRAQGPSASTSTRASTTSSARSYLLVMLVPFTLNGIAVREAFFVSFLGSVGVGSDQAFAAGFLFFLVTLLLAFPGGLIMLRDGLRCGARPEVEHG